ncbi:hypothetical protein D3C87_1517120 [compost metagenome]
MSTESSFCTFIISVVTFSEWPPSSKKLSVTPSRSTPNIRLHIWASFFSVSVSGLTTGRSNSSRCGTGSARRLILPFAVRGHSASGTINLGTIYEGKCSASRVLISLSSTDRTAITCAQSHLSPLSSACTVTIASFKPSIARRCFSISLISMR